MTINTTKQVKGGQVKKLASNAYIAEGNTHKQGGIKLGNAEVENQEVITSNPDNTTAIYSNQLGYAKVAKQLVKQKGLLENEIVKINNKNNNLTDNKSTDKIILDTKKRKVQVNSLAISDKLKNINDIDNKLNDLINLQEAEKQYKGLSNNQGEYGFGDWFSWFGIKKSDVDKAFKDKPLLKQAADKTLGAANPVMSFLFPGQKANDLAKTELDQNKTLAEQQKADQLANMKAYQEAVDKIFADYKPVDIPYSNYNGTFAIKDQTKFAEGTRKTVLIKSDTPINNASNTGTTVATAISQGAPAIVATNQSASTTSSSTTSNRRDSNGDSINNTTTPITPTIKLPDEPVLSPFTSASAFNYKNIDLDITKLNKLNANDFQLDENIDKIPDSQKYDPTLVNNSDLSKSDVKLANTNLASDYEANVDLATADTTNAVLAKSNLNTVGYDVLAQQAAIQSNKTATNRMILNNTSNSSVARALAMQNNQNATLAEAQVLENKTNQENAQRAANTAILNTTEQFNTNTQNTVNQYNSNARNQISLANAQAKTNVNLANAQNKTNVNLANTQTANQMEQFNIANQNTANAAYTDILNKVTLANADTKNQAQQYNITTQNAINQQNVANKLATQESNLNASMNIDRYNSDVTNNALITNNTNQNSVARYNADINNNMSQFNATQSNQWNMNAYNAKINQNSALLNSKLGITSNIYSKYGGIYPTLSKYGYGGIIDQYYANLFSATNKYYDFNIQKYQTMSDNRKKFFTDLFKTGISAGLNWLQLPGNPLGGSAATPIK